MALPTRAFPRFAGVARAAGSPFGIFSQHKRVCMPPPDSDEADEPWHTRWAAIALSRRAELSTVGLSLAGALVSSALLSASVMVLRSQPPRKRRVHGVSPDAAFPPTPEEVKAALARHRAAQRAAGFVGLRALGAATAMTAVLTAAVAGVASLAGVTSAKGFRASIERALRPP